MVGLWRIGEKRMWRQIERWWMASEWHPIETAPKDGREVLIHGKGGMIKVCWRDGDDWNWATDGTFVSAIYKPTHWMPLPEPPSP